MPSTKFHRFNYDYDICLAKQMAYSEQRLHFLIIRL